MSRKSSENKLIIIALSIVFNAFQQLINFFSNSYSEHKKSQHTKVKNELVRKDKFPNRIVDGNLSLYLRNNDIIERQVSSISTSAIKYSYFIDNLVRDCINDICIAEGRNEIRPGHKYLSDWYKTAPEEWKILSTQIKKFLTEKNEQFERQKREKEELVLSEKLRSMLDKHSELISQFNDIAYRKVTTIDIYGEENWDALEKEARLLVEKIAKKDGITEDTIKRWRRYSLPKEYLNLVDKLSRDFKDHYADQKTKVIEIEGVENLSGVEFENYVADLLRNNGFEKVLGTPTTGDQGADLIAKRNGKTIVIQVKRYSSAVGNKAVQEVAGAINFYCGDEGWVITNSSFTKSARELASKNNIKLIDGKDLQVFKSKIQ